MILFNFLFILCLASLVRCRSTVQQDSKTGTKGVTFERFQKTCGAWTMPIIIDITGVRFEENICYVNSTAIVNEDITEDPRVEITVDRCKTRENLDSCEEFHKIKSNSYCNLLNVPGFYNTFMSTYEPPFVCPPKKGIYKTDHGYVDVRGIIMFPASGWYWKVKEEVFEKKTGRKLLCLNTETRYH